MTRSTNPLIIITIIIIIIIVIHNIICGGLFSAV